MTATATEAPIKRVLVVEDEAAMARLLSRALTKAGFEVVIEETGTGALERMRRERFALILLDLTLPDIDGLSVLRSRQEISPDHPVMVLSALGDVGSKVASLELGANDYMTKPFALPELIARVRMHTHELRIGRDRRLRSGGMALDRARRVVETATGAMVQLTTREAVLLEFLMEREGQACTRADILEAVWGSAFDPGTNIVDVCVARLRQKLGGDCVATVRSVGYEFLGA